MIKRILVTFAAVAAFLLCSPGTGAQNLFEAGELPDAVKFLPAPPAEGSAAFAYDIACYEAGKALREGPRGRQAIREATTNIDSMAVLFSSAFGYPLSKENTPRIMELLRSGVRTIRLGATAPKAAYMRKRPFVYFGEQTILPEEDDELRDTGSYPSGHTVRGWGMALILAEINPAAQDAVLKAGYEWGQSRVIGGFHWQSDIDAARLLSSACYARLHTSPEFQKQLARARREFRRISRKNR